MYVQCIPIYACMHVCIYVSALLSLSILPLHCRESAAAMSRWSDGSLRFGSGPSAAWQGNRFIWPYMYVCMYVCMYVFMYVCMHRMYVPGGVGAPLRSPHSTPEKWRCSRGCRWTSDSSQPTYIHTYMYITYIHILIHTLNSYTLHTHMNTYISISVTVIFIAPLHTYIHTNLYLVVCNFNIYQLIHTYIHIYIHTYIHT
jgi:hypothetical protein